MEKEIKQFVKQLNEKYPEYVASYTQGKKFYKIWRTFGAQKCIYCFVDMDGNIYKAASINAPAKHIRGHISEPFKDNCCGRYGIKYLKGPNF
jgi:hypothetical protein